MTAGTIPTGILAAIAGLMLGHFASIDLLRHQWNRVDCDLSDANSSSDKRKP
jgi:hypothetical protein